ncbi:MAG TPA: hypothetical protein VLE99_02420 [Candidatus Saccharimonadales bacterium]|nr:hypothetical protein [Candidatus Saccharimonadales bacterium]
MKQTLGEQGELNVLLLPLIGVAMLLLVALSLTVWAYGGRQDYKNNSDAKVAAAVAADKQVVQAADAKQYAEASKSPLKTYVGPDAYGSVHIGYPKTWSAYIDTTNSSTPLDAYFHDDYVPSIQSKQTYNLRVQVTATAYSQILSRYTQQLGKGITAAPYSLPKVPSVIGTELSGSVFPNSGESGAQSGAIVLLPLRDKTLEIWTESTDYLKDFNTYVLPNLSFSP